MASDFFRKLYDKGEFIEKTSMQYYDEEAHQFLADRYIVGTCPHCGSDHAYGDQCEACGTSLNATDLIEPHSAITGNKPVLKETNTGICRSTSGNLHCATGFLTSTRNGNQTYTDSANHGSTWVCNHAP